MVSLRKGKTKSILESAIDSALLAVEVYNKPRTTFRSQAYIALMIMAWTRLFHAHFNNTIGDRYYYKKNSRYQMIDGEKKAWEISECIKQFSDLSEPVRKNLEFFIKMRNKIEHRHLDAREVDVSIFGECQSLLFNFENQLIKFFGKGYSINEALVYSLQFSQLRTNGQSKSSKSILSNDTADILNYIATYRRSLSESIFNAQEFSIKLLQIPKISNTNRTDAAVEFVRWDELSEDDKQAYNQIIALVKDKKVKVEGANTDRLKPGKVVEEIKRILPHIDFSTMIHTALWRIFKIRPASNAEDPFETNVNYCHYDEAHNDYVYQRDWVDFVASLFLSNRITVEEIKRLNKNKQQLEINDYSS